MLTTGYGILIFAETHDMLKTGYEYDILIIALI